LLRQYVSDVPMTAHRIGFLVWPGTKALTLNARLLIL
ncbi:transcriptional regulator ArgR, partial [Pseudomonas amygdali pv. mori str. 301020]